MRNWVLGVAGLVLLAGCASLPAIAPAGTGQGLTSVVPTTAAATSGPTSTQAAPTSAIAVATTAATSENSAPATTRAVATAAPTAALESTTAPEATPAIACTPGALTPGQTEGPYYKANPPETASLWQPGMGGTKLTITGYVLDAQCQPVPGARVDFWQADSEGQYDNLGYTLRGYQMTDAQGRYTVETVVPGLYPGRTRHIHVKVTAPNGPTLTTQLYFPDDAANAADGIFSPQIVMTIEKTTTGEKATFDFVIGT